MGGGHMIRILALGLVAFALVCGCDDTADRCARICHKLIACFPKAPSSLDKECRLSCKDARDKNPESFDKEWKFIESLLAGSCEDLLNNASQMSNMGGMPVEAPHIGSKNGKSADN